MKTVVQSRCQAVRDTGPYIPACSAMRKTCLIMARSVFQGTDWANLQKEDKEKWVQFLAIWESVLVRAENPLPLPWDLWSGITQEAQRWKLHVWPGRAHDTEARGGYGLWSENCCRVCLEASLHTPKWIITWLPIFLIGKKEEKKKERSKLYLAVTVNFMYTKKMEYCSVFLFWEQKNVFTVKSKVILCRRYQRKFMWKSAIPLNKLL